MSDAVGGSYTLVVDLAADATLSAGALGEHRLPAGAYAYTGSALGSGGFARVDRHRRTARDDHDVRHWHVDYLLGHPAARIDRVVRSAGVDVECAVAERLPEGPVDGFGASDCGCPSHLAAADGLDALAERALAAHEAAIPATDHPEATVEVVAGSEA
ncbi:GIY-YIG nuclease family protein [Halorubrum sp. RMP-47]|uniref:GIY-YIG nuclease family protein n=1 Tax=Halorubrum miltondacostae TaxID=3076378 RepID=A0ABD5M2G8_9EURY